MDTKVIITPAVDEAILEHLDYIDIDAIPSAIASIQRAQSRLIDVLSTFPQGGAKFTADTNFFTIDGYVFIYDYDLAENVARVFDMHFPGQNWK
jgi:signal transduction histidine kinase